MPEPHAVQRRLGAVGLKARLPWMPAFVSFGGFFLLRYFGYDPFPASC